MIVVRIVMALPCYVLASGCTLSTLRCNVCLLNEKLVSEFALFEPVNLIEVLKLIRSIMSKPTRVS